MHSLLRIVAIYIPPPYSNKIIKKVLSFLYASPNPPVLIIGDFNNYLPYSFNTGSIDPNAQPMCLFRLLEEVGIYGRLDSLVLYNTRATLPLTIP